MGTKYKGMRVGKLVITGIASKQYLSAICDCGKTCTISYSAILNGNKKSCGCSRFPPKVRRKCRYCGKTMIVGPKSKKLFCSRECYLAKRRRKYRHKCKQCGRLFESNSWRMFCSRSCHDRWRRRSRSMVQEVPRECLDCVRKWRKCGCSWMMCVEMLAENYDLYVSRTYLQKLMRKEKDYVSRGSGTGVAA